MAETYDQMIARLKAQKASQKSEVKEVPKVKPKEDEDDEDDFDDEEEEKPVEKQIATKNQKTQESTANKQATISQSEEEKIAMQIELLQNNGRYRAEKLFQLQEINKNLGLIAEILLGKNGTTE